MHDALMSVEIEVRNVIFLAGRGTVVVGHVLSGVARVGLRTELLDLGGATPQRLEVSTVERLSSMDARGQAVGIVFRDPPALNDLKRILLPGNVLVLEEPAETPARGR